MSGYRSGGYRATEDRPDADEFQRPKPFNWRLWLGVSLGGGSFLTVVALLFFVVSMVNDPKGTANLMTLAFHLAIILLMIAGVAALLLGLFYGLGHARFAWKVKPIHARDERFPILYDSRGQVTMVDNQQPRYRHAHVIQQPDLPALPAPEVVEADEEPARMPTVHFRDVTGQLGPGQLFLGMRQNGQPRIGTWDEYKSVLVIGDSSSGKTNTIAQLVAQAVQSGAQLVICDPHANKRDSLKNKIMPALAPYLYPGTGVALQHPEILHQVHLVRDLLERRVAGETGPDIVLVVEEWNRLQRDAHIAEELAIIGEALGQEGRGFGIFGLFGAQTMIGFARNKRAFISYIVHRCDEIEARQVIPAPYAKLAPDLGKGATFFKDADGKTEPLQMALIEARDLAEVARFAPPARKPLVWQAAAPVAVAAPSVYPPGWRPRADYDASVYQPLPSKPGRVRLDEDTTGTGPQELPIWTPAPQPVPPPPDGDRDEDMVPQTIIPIDRKRGGVGEGGGVAAAPAPKQRWTPAQYAYFLAHRRAGESLSAIQHALSSSSSFWYTVRAMEDHARQCGDLVNEEEAEGEGEDEESVLVSEEEAARVGTD